MAWTRALLIVALCFGVALCGIDLVTITPDADCQFENESCLTLSEFAYNFTNESYGGSNLTLKFLGGNHSLPMELLFVNLSTVSMVANEEMSPNFSQPLIICDDEARIEFLHLQTVEIAQLKLVGCIRNRVEDVQYFTLEYSSFIGQKGKDGTALQMFETTAHILNSSFINNVGDTTDSIGCEHYRINTTTGGAIYIQESEATINQSYFAGNSAGTGGAVFSNVNSSITIIHSAFAENYATLDTTVTRFCHYSSGGGGGGGALYVENAKVVMLIDSDFTENSASTTQLLGGAAVVNQAKSVTITGCRFHNNTSGYHGAAIYIFQVSSLSIFTGDFKHNFAQYDGGAVYVGACNAVTVTGSIFSDNTAYYDNGGAIYLNQGGKLNLTASVFTNNRACDHGGAIYLVDSNIVAITNSTFRHNLAYYYDAGAIYVNNNNSVTLATSHFSENRAHDKGGALYVENGNTLDVNGSTFNNNLASDDGGAVYVDGCSTYEVTTSGFNNNSARYGGALYTINSNTFKVSISQFNENTVSQDGGAIYMESGDTVTIATNNFNGNFARDKGGALYLIYANIVHVNTSTFTINRASDHGGAVYVRTGYTVAIATSIFTNNLSGDDGGAVYMDAIDMVDLATNKFSHNRADDNGGAVYVQGGITMAIAASNYTDNLSDDDGGAVYADRIDTVDVSTSTFSNNTAVLFGGAVFVDDSDTFSITTSDFENNTACYGGAIRGEMNTIDITDCQLNANQARRGGALDLRLNSRNAGLYTFSLLQNKFHGNQAFYGGVMNVYRGRASAIIILLINESDFSSNVAQSGGVFTLDSNIHPGIISNSNFSDNIAHEHGGVMELDRADIKMIESNFVNNTATQNGGTVSMFGGSLTVVDSLFEHNSAGESGGAVQSESGVIIVSGSDLITNTATSGGVLFTQSATVSLQGNLYINNSASIHGGVFYSVVSSTTVAEGTFTSNRADNNGGVFYIDRGSTSVQNSTFSNNSAGNNGAVMRSQLNNLSISGCSFKNNYAEFEGGVLWTDQVELNVSDAGFLNNTAHSGGAIHSEQGNTQLRYTLFTKNRANAGGVLWGRNTNIQCRNTCNFIGNKGLFSVIFLMTSTSEFSTITFSDNIGSIIALESNVLISGISKMENNTLPLFTSVINRLYMGGAITAAFQTHITIKGTCEFKNNIAEKGGAINVIESKAFILGNVSVVENQGLLSGGGINLEQSELICFRNSTLTLYGNDGSEKGGGVMATSSTILVKGSYNFLNISNNSAINGGGFYFQLNSYFIIIKPAASNNKTKIVLFSSNSASDNGGAVYVSDDGKCSLLTVTDCTFQTLAVYRPRPNDRNFKVVESHNIFFHNNTAGVSGNSLFGGLLDRCTISKFAEPNINKVDMDYSPLNDSMITDGAEYLLSISNIQASDISSDPVRVCFCPEDEGLPDCTHQPAPLKVDRGQQNKVSVSISVVDQLNQPLYPATVRSQLGSGNFLCQNNVQNMKGTCTKIDFAVDSVNETEELILSLDDGPCEHTPESKGRMTILFVCDTCPIGFQPQSTETGCKCSCDPQLFPFFTNCSGDVLVRESNAWVTFLNNSASYHNVDNQYLVHPYCPLDYCQPPSSNIMINLNQVNGADSQCTNHRSGLLCSTCQTGFSLSLGSSRCIQCSTLWPIKLVIITISAIVGGLLLVAFLLSLNLTVALGTLNGIIFYANIVSANRTILMPSQTPKFITIFISWLNLEIGIDTCFYDGLNTYWKTLLQFAFPAYIIFLVIVVIAVAKYSNKFAKLIGKRNPVATLTTLILLSYAKLLHNVIASLSSTVLDYPDRNSEIVWFPDATVGYLKGKHIALFVIAVLILIAGIFYTTILLLWQWFLHFSDKKLFAWINNQKLCQFIEPYHAPYTFKHRYWTGLLLLARVILYIIFASNFQGDPQLPLLVIIIIVGLLVLLKGLLNAKIYKKWPIDILEMIMYFNLIAFAALTWYYVNEEKSKTAIATTSVSITFILLVIVIAFHVYKFSYLQATMEKKQVLQKIKAKLPGDKKNLPDPPPPNTDPLLPDDATELRPVSHSTVSMFSLKREQSLTV